MKLKMKKKIMIISFLAMLVLGQASYAAVEIVPSKNGAGTDGIVRSSISNSYTVCQNMKNAGESLNGTTVLPHLATNADWGAVSYLSNSAYGTNTAGANTGTQITIDGVKYYSTTGNATGVMNWGANPNTTRYTQTSGLIKAYVDAEANNNNKSTAKDYVENLFLNKDSRYVEVINTGSFTVNNTLGMAMAETKNIYSGIWGTYNVYVDYPTSVRKGLFGFLVGYNGYSGGYLTGPYSSGAANEYVTFRPVVWNK